jgi:hypothetical protein
MPFSFSVFFLSQYSPLSISWKACILYIIYFLYITGLILYLRVLSLYDLSDFLMVVIFLLLDSLQVK